MVLTTCAYCGKEFLCHDWRLIKRQHVFCSRKCNGQFVKEHNPNYIPCAVCGKLFYVKPSDQKQSKQERCCSRECLGKYRKKIYLGESNPNFGNRGAKNPIWKSDKKISAFGYVLVRNPNHPFANCDGFVFEHRLVAERMLLTDDNSVEVDGAKYLKPEYEVHHKDFNRQNNNPENLLVLTKSDHMKLHMELRRQQKQEVA